jgi:predicted nucleic acid-binding protein
VIARFLIDTSAAVRMRLVPIADRLEPLITGGLVATCATLDAEVLYRARRSDESEQARADRREAYEYLPTDDDHWQRAFDAQRLLARTARHRAVGIADLLTAVLATEHRLTIVHYDADFEIATEVLPFDHRWFLPRGTAQSTPSRCASRGVRGATRYIRTRGRDLGAGLLTWAGC